MAGDMMELEEKYLVLKWSDIEGILNAYEQADLVKLVRIIRHTRALKGKKENKYVVINQDEPYFPDVLKLMEQAEQAGARAEETARRRSQGAKDGWEIRRAKKT